MLIKRKFNIINVIDFYYKVRCITNIEYCIVIINRIITDFYLNFGRRDKIVNPMGDSIVLTIASRVYTV